MDEALAKVENGDNTAIETITKNLDVVLDEDTDFAEELRVLAQTIQAGKIQDNSSMNQTNYGGTNFQNKVEGGEVYQAATININKT